LSLPLMFHIIDNVYYMKQNEEKFRLLRRLQEALLDQRSEQAGDIIAELRAMPLSYLETELIANYEVLIHRTKEKGRRWGLDIWRFG
jgi:hypothetical protein